MSKLTEELAKAAGNLFELYKRTHLHHFNVTGKTFKQDHSFLGDLYEEFNGHFDSVSELIRIEGEFVPVDFQSKAVLPALSTSYDRVSTFQDVLMSMQIAIASLTSAHKEAADANSIGTFTTLETIIESMQKSRWMVQSSL